MPCSATALGTGAHSRTALVTVKDVATQVAILTRRPTALVVKSVRAELDALADEHVLVRCGEAWPGAAPRDRVDRYFIADVPRRT